MGEISQGSVRDAEVPGSNPGSPTRKSLLRVDGVWRSDEPIFFGANLARNEISSTGWSAGPAAEERLTKDLRSSAISGRRSRRAERQRHPRIRVAQTHLRRFTSTPPATNEVAFSRRRSWESRSHATRGFGC
jgi:hypothetical protein